MSMCPCSPRWSLVSYALPTRALGRCLTQWPTCVPPSLPTRSSLHAQSTLTRVVQPSEIEICKTADGSDWQLGYGTFGEVRDPCWLTRRECNRHSVIVALTQVRMLCNQRRQPCAYAAHRTSQVFKGLRGRVQDVAVKRMPHRMTSKKALARLRDEVQVHIISALFRPTQPCPEDAAKTLYRASSCTIDFAGRPCIMAHEREIHRGTMLAAYRRRQHVRPEHPCACSSSNAARGAERCRFAQIMERVSFDRNIVQYYGAWLEQDDAPFLVMEYMEVRTGT